MTPLRRAWRAASAPRAFYADLPDRPALGTAAAAAAIAGLVGSVVLAAVAARATGSAPLPTLLVVPALALPYLALVTVLGGLVLMRPAALDLRAWEIAAWAWTPAGFLGLALLPIGLAAPAPTLFAASLMLPLWHLWLVWSGTSTHASGRPRLAVVLYAAAVFVAPTGLTIFTLAVLTPLAG